MVTRARPSYTRDFLTPGICSLIKPAAMVKLMQFPAKIHTVMLWFCIIPFPMMFLSTDLKVKILQHLTTLKHARTLCIFIGMYLTYSPGNPCFSAWMITCPVQSVMKLLIHSQILTVMKFSHVLHSDLKIQMFLRMKLTSEDQQVEIKDVALKETFCKQSVHMKMTILYTDVTSQHPFAYLLTWLWANRKWQDYVYIQCEYKSTKQKIKHLLREENKVKENKIS